MDSLTHIVVGACVGELVAGKQLGKRAMLIGAIANSFPDIDFLASFFLPVTADLLAHRGFTHSFLFVLLASPLLAGVSMKLFYKRGYPYSNWVSFWMLQMFLHVFIDAFNAYGTGWFEPFSHVRVSFQTMFVADPLFTLWPSVASIVLLVLPLTYPRRKTVATVALLLCTVYLGIGIANKLSIDRHIEQEMADKGIVPERYMSTPTPLNNMLWYVVIKKDSGFYITYRSVWDRSPSEYRYVCQNHSLIAKAKDTKDMQRLLRFSQGYYTLDILNDTLVFNDLRFGEIMGWQDSLPRCVFYYYPELPDDNKLIVQRGRFARWDGQAIRSFIHRITGR